MKHVIKSLCMVLCFGALFVACGDDSNDGKYTITVKSNDEAMGHGYGSGEYEEGTELRIWGTPETGYQFSRWDDGNTDNPRTITVTGNKVYTAIFSTIGGGGDNPGGGGDNPGGGDTPGDVSCSFTVDGTSYAGIALISYGADQGGSGLYGFYILTGEGGTEDAMFVVWINPQTGVQNFNMGANCQFLNGQNDVVTASNGLEYPHYQTISQCEYSINVTAFDLTSQYITLTSSGQLFDIMRAENGEGGHFVDYSVSIDGYWQYPSAPQQ